MHKTAALLKRFAALVPDVPYPASINDLTGQQRMLLANDPELLAVMSGTATASLEASVLDGSFPDSFTAPTADQIKAARVAEIVAQQPGGRDGYYQTNHDGSSTYVDPVAPNMSLLMELATLDQQAYAQQELQRKPPAADPGAVTAEGAAYANQAMAEARLASRNAGAQG